MINPLKIKRKTIELNAIKYTGNNAKEVLHWMFPDIESEVSPFDLTIQTVEGTMKVKKGSYIVKDEYNGFFSYTEKEFKRLYEIIE